MLNLISDFLNIERPINIMFKYLNPNRELIEDINAAISIAMWIVLFVIWFKDIMHIFNYVFEGIKYFCNFTLSVVKYCGRRSTRMYRYILRNVLL